MKFADDLVQPLFATHGDTPEAHTSLQSFPRQLHHQAGPASLGALLCSTRAVNLTYGLDPKLAAHPHRALHVILDREHISLLSHFPYAQRLDYVEKRSASLSEDLMSWPSLRVMALHNNKKIKSLHKHFALATQLDALILNGLWNLTHIKGLSRMPSLKYLSLNGCIKLEDYAPIGAHPTLRHLHVKDEEIERLIEPLTRATHLHALELDTCCTDPSDMSMLGELLEARGDLEKLGLQDSHLDASLAGKFPRGLVELDLAQTFQVTQGMFAGLKSLRALNLSYYPENHFPEDMADLTSLELLDLSMSSQLTDADFSVCASLQALTHINLDQSPLARIPDAFAELRKLEQLSLKTTHTFELEDLSALRGLPALRQFDVPGFTRQAHLEEIVMSLPSIQHLGVHRHIDIRPFASHPSLKFITRMYEPYTPEETEGLFELCGATAFLRRG